MLTVTRTYKVADELTTQGKDHDVNDVSKHKRCTSSYIHSGKLKGGEEAPE
jgi:hypothetical protein